MLDVIQKSPEVALTQVDIDDALQVLTAGVTVKMLEFDARCRMH